MQTVNNATFADFASLIYPFPICLTSITSQFWHNMERIFYNLVWKSSFKVLLALQILSFNLNWWIACKAYEAVIVKEKLFTPYYTDAQAC